MVYTVNRAAGDILAHYFPTATRGSLRPRILCRMAPRQSDRQKGVLRDPMGGSRSWEDVILQGPHLYVATPMYKSPNETMKNKLDWSEHRSREAYGTRRYSCDCIQANRRSRLAYDADYTQWDMDLHEITTGSHGEIWRQTLMSERLIPALIRQELPIRTASSALVSLRRTLNFCACVSGFLQSPDRGLCSARRAIKRGYVPMSTIDRLPVSESSFASTAMLLRSLRLELRHGRICHIYGKSLCTEVHSTPITGLAGRTRANRPRLG